MTRIVWGLLPEPSPDDPDRGDVILGGCCMPVEPDGTDPEWVCREHPPAHLAELVEEWDGGTLRS
jgi:hypothetical protein